VNIIALETSGIYLEDKNVRAHTYQVKQSQKVRF